MENHQNLSLLFWHRKSKQDKDSYAPVICQISIKGSPQKEISTGEKVHIDEWDLENKKATGKDKKAKEINLKISELTVDLNRHFILLQSRHEKITPLMLKNVYLGKHINRCILVSGPKRTVFEQKITKLRSIKLLLIYNQIHKGRKKQPTGHLI